MLKLNFKKMPEICPICRSHKLVRQPRGFLMRMIPKSEKSRCPYCETVVVRIFRKMTLAV